MLAVGIVLNIIGLGFFCWVLFTLAIYAPPFFVGMSAGLYAYDTGVSSGSRLERGARCPLHLTEMSLRPCEALE